MKRFFRQYGRLTLALAAVLAFCAVLPLLFQQSRSIETGSWGLSFRTEGQPPVGNASKEALRRYDAVYLGDETQKKIYLTFDAGYENGCTEPILEALAKHNVKAAFFVVGNYIEQNPDLVRRMLREGHIVGNHTYHHYDMSKLSDEAAFNQELTSLETLYRETTGEDMPRYYRPPQGIYSECNLEMAQKLGYRTVFWSLAYVDWYQDNQPTDEQAFSKLLPRIHPGAIVLLHSTSATNAEILDDLLGKTFIRSAETEIPVGILMRQTMDTDLKQIVAGAEGDYYPLDLTPSTKDIPAVMATIRRCVADDDRFEVSFSGSYFSNRNMVGQLVGVLIVALLLLFFILAAQFESLVQPWIILSEIVIDLFGALIVLWFFGVSLNLMSMIGLIVVCGIVINDSILKIDTINTLRRQGVSLKHAILEAGQRRLKAIVMTSLTTILAVLPFLARGDMGSDLQFPMSLVIISGMTVGTLVSVFFIPLAYYEIYKPRR